MHARLHAAPPDTVNVEAIAIDRMVHIHAELFDVGLRRFFAEIQMECHRMPLCSLCWIYAWGIFSCRPTIRTFLSNWVQHDAASSAVVLLAIVEHRMLIFRKSRGAFFDTFEKLCCCESAFID